MTLNTKIRVLWIFWRFLAVSYISKANCAEITKDRPEQPACEIFGIKRKFYPSKSRFSMFKKVCERGHQLKRDGSSKCAFTACQTGNALWRMSMQNYKYMFSLPSCRMSIAAIGELRLVHSKSSYMQRCRAFLFR